jgi:hypothetical protein
MQSKKHNRAQRKALAATRPTRPGAASRPTPTIQDSAEEQSITAFGLGVFHLSSTCRIPIKFSLKSEDAVAPGTFEVTADSEILALEWIHGAFEEGLVHVEVCGVHFLTRVMAQMKTNGALLLQAGPFYRELAHEMASEPRPWRTFW